MEKQRIWIGFRFTDSPLADEQMNTIRVHVYSYRALLIVANSFFCRSDGRDDLLRPINLCKRDDGTKILLPFLFVCVGCVCLCLLVLVFACCLCSLVVCVCFIFFLHTCFCMWCIFGSLVGWFT